MEHKKKHINLDECINRIHIASPPPPIEHSALRSFEKLKKRINKNDYTVRHLHRSINYYRIGLVASIAILLVVLGGWAYTSSKHESTFIVKSNKSHIVKQVRLEDGTIIKLNNSSQIIYPEHFSSNKREIFLEGEAYFDVAHNAKSPFIVRTGELTIKVLGTKFTVNANSSNSLITASLLEGSIEIFDRENKLKMIPNQRVTYHIHNKKMELSSIKDATSEICWTENLWILSNTPLLEICQRLENQFNIKFIIMNENLINKTFTGQFHTNESLESILETLQISTSFKYERKKEHIIIR